MRNREPIAETLAQVLPDTGLVLELASGSGEHALYLAERFPRLDWQPSDCDTESLASIAAWIASAGRTRPNLRPPIWIDASDTAWPIDRADAILCINMTHISPWAATAGLFANAARLLPASGLLAIYGPFIETGVPTAPSNLAFDASLKARNREWGLRELSALDALGEAVGLARVRRFALPANNLLVVWRRA